LELPAVLWKQKFAVSLTLVSVESFILYHFYCYLPETSQ